MHTQIGNLSSVTASASASTYSLKTQLLHSLATSVEYRHAFVEEKVRTGLAVQLKSMREQRKMTQVEFAKTLNKSQSWVSRLEDPNKPVPTVSTLLLLAKAYDVDLDVRFVPFSQMLQRLSRLTPEGFQVPSFSDEYETRTFGLAAEKTAQKRDSSTYRMGVAVGASASLPISAGGTLHQKISIG